MDPMLSLTAPEVVELLGLEPHPEGGFYREVSRSEQTTSTPRGMRALSSAILFLVTAEQPSRLHRLASDEVWLHLAGAPVDLVMMMAGGATVVTLASVDDLASCAPQPLERWRPQELVPAGVWQGARLTNEHTRPAWGLVTCVVSPGFDFADFEIAGRADLLRAHPEERDLILALT